MNLFIGVLCYHFGAANETSSAKTLFLTREQQIWIELQQCIVKNNNILKTKPENKEKPTAFKKMIHSKQFDIFVMICIISNAVIMALNYEGSPSSYTTILENFNYAFTVIFALECVIKIMQLGFFAYLKKGWNKLDILIVFLSLLDILFEYVIGATSNKLLRTGPQIIRIFRIVRVVRVLKLIKKLQSLKKIIESLIISLPNVLNVAILLILFYYIYAIMGVFLFKDIITGSYIDKYTNFSNFFSAFVTMIGVLTGQTWTNIFFDCFRLPPNCVANENCGTSTNSFNYFDFKFFVFLFSCSPFLFYFFYNNWRFYYAKSFCPCAFGFFKSRKYKFCIIYF